MSGTASRLDDSLIEVITRAWYGTPDPEKRSLNVIAAIENWLDGLPGPKPSGFSSERLKELCRKMADGEERFKPVLIARILYSLPSQREGSE